MAKKREESLEEGLNRSASKRGLTGKDRHRYIGGALHNMGKSKPRSGGKSKSVRPAPAHKPTPKPKVDTRGRTAVQPTPKPKPAVVHKPVPPKEKIALTVKKNTEASKANNGIRTIYSVYDAKGREYGSYKYTKLSKARSEARDMEDAYNRGYKQSSIR